MHKTKLGLELQKNIHLHFFNSIIITDGAYLFKPIYKEYWDLKIYLKTEFNIALKRGIERDLQQFGHFEHAKEKYEKRYHLASKIYILENNPENEADIIINNSNFENLIIEKQ